MYNESILAHLIGKNGSLEGKETELYNIFSDMPDLHDIMLLSAQYYEKKEIKARLSFVTKEDQSLALEPEYKEKVRFNKANLRQITKFLAATDKDHPLIMKPAEGVSSEDLPAYDAAGISSSPVSPADFTFSVQINGHMNYSFFVGDNHYFDFRDGIYSVPHDSISELGKILEDMEAKASDIENFKGHIEKLVEGGHGTTIVFCRCNTFFENEKARLVGAKRGIEIAPVDLFEENEAVDAFLRQTAVADGGFLVDSCGRCKAINVIFDGEIKTEWGDSFSGETARGSRFNSLKTYVFGKNYRCLYCDDCSSEHKCVVCNGCDSSNGRCNSGQIRIFAIIISDDGMVNIVS